MATFPEEIKVVFYFNVTANPNNGIHFITLNVSHIDSHGHFVKY